MTTNLVLRASLLGVTAHATFLLLPYQIAFAQAEQSLGDTSPAAARAGTSTEGASDTTSDELPSIKSIIVTDAASCSAGHLGTKSRIRIKQKVLQFFGKTEISIKRLPGVGAESGSARATSLRGMVNGYTLIQLMGTHAQRLALDSL